MGEPTRAFSAVDDIDPDLDVDDPAPHTVLADIKADMEADLATPKSTEPLRVPGREGYAVVYSLVMNHETFQAWQKRCTDRQSGVIDEFKVGQIVLANQCAAICRHGEEVLEDGEPVTFRTKAFHQLLDVDRAVAAVRKFYGRDSDVISAARSVLKEAGYYDVLAEAEEAPDPTSG